MDLIEFIDGWNFLVLDNYASNWVLFKNHDRSAQLSSHAYWIALQDGSLAEHFVGCKGCLDPDVLYIIHSIQTFEYVSPNWYSNPFSISTVPGNTLLYWILNT